MSKTTKRFTFTFHQEKYCSRLQNRKGGSGFQFTEVKNFKDSQQNKLKGRGTARNL